MTHREHFVLIRGLLREARHWGEFTGSLQQQFPHATISTPDIPGNGQMHQATSPKTIAEMTEALREKINANQPLRLIALSMGGMIAMDWMTRYPDEVEAAVLINTSARPLSPFYHRLRWTVYLQVLKMIFDSATQKEADILGLTSNHHSNDRKLLESWQQWQQQNPVSKASARNQFLAAAKFSVTDKPQQPLLVVTSRADRLVDYRCSLKLAETWQTSYMQHETAGHDLPLDEPEWLAHVIKQWFALQTGV
ncbi:MAG: alpha/beta hydrolase [Nitrosomonas sp.]|uniref:alpha/beta fold hydrolase n=1 Tax=Nitrosomonas sp. TaxID=42353 RepID=UPI002715A90D|nr:alpha/beta hydrolase [Nitrosomonas sp.]MDO8894795.1 alpha/beta hydrolase [Nitrosomonas sp.]MDP1550005.1 alpha/beta hydrolase [Nitrosomonas sp.]